MSSSAPEEASSATGGDEMERIVLTDACVERLKVILSDSDGGATALRVGVDGGGCSGFQYTFSLDTSSQPGDRVFERAGARVVVDDISFDFLKGSTVDYQEEMIKSSFAIAENPNAESGCGCGTSFSAK